MKRDLKRISSLIIGFIVLIGMLSSCSTSNHVVSGKMVQKRKYTKGYSVSKNTKIKTTEKTEGQIASHYQKENSISAENNNKSKEKAEFLVSSEEFDLIKEPYIDRVSTTTATIISRQKETPIKRKFIKKALELSQLLKNSKHTEVNKNFDKLNIDHEEPDVASKSKYDGFAIAGFVLGVLSIVLIPVGGIGLLISPLVITFSAIGMKRVKKRKTRGNGLAIAGLVMGLTLFLFVAIIIGLVWSGIRR